MRWLCPLGGATPAGPTGGAPGERQFAQPDRLGGSGSRGHHRGAGAALDRGPGRHGLRGRGSQPGWRRSAPEPGGAAAATGLVAALAPIDGGVAAAALLGLRASGGGWSAALGPLGGHPPACPGGDGSPSAAWAPDLGSGLAFGLGRCPGDGHPGGTGDGERLPGQPGGLALAGRGLAVLLQRAGDAAGLRVDGPLPGGEGAVPHRTGPPRVSPLATRRGAPRARRSR